MNITSDFCRVDSEDEEGPSMVEVLPPQPTTSDSGAPAVPRFVPIIPQNKEKPVCPLCPRKFIITSPKSICTTCHAQFHKRLVKQNLFLFQTSDILDSNNLYFSFAFLFQINFISAV